ncbi:Formyl transferase [Salinimicrobium catena]|uniref:phosphoribosylglycinamide formyltransferase 1 n=1 Tax=Salinimicrobium catena TaxID=390640 RepID=A0A1H5NDH5_9FLAO|nr:formyltransferase family protein [Salinimicrobium catena]SDL42015.1 Formyl transferase [Salinimicrobium catena]SEE98921.1 Formyl transferase [Salinimicrobium catena]
MKVVFLTSDSLRHKYIAASIAQEMELGLIISEKKSPKIQDTAAYGKKDAEFLAEHFQQRAKTEEELFGTYTDFPPEVPRIDLPHGNINSEEVFEIITKTNPDLILLFGTSIIKDPLLGAYQGKIINLHLGLSPYYRGSATNLYPYLFDEPECIGATIHLATEKVDEGGILYQLRPDIEEGDSMHMTGNKVILKAGKILPTVMQDYFEGKLIPVPQTGHGRLCRNKDVTPYVLRQIYKNFEEGMIGRYLKNKGKRDAKRPIVE